MNHVFGLMTWTWCVYRSFYHPRLYRSHILKLSIPLSRIIAGHYVVPHIPLARISNHMPVCNECIQGRGPTVFPVLSHCVIVKICLISTLGIKAQAVKQTLDHELRKKGESVESGVPQEQHYKTLALWKAIGM